MMQKQPICELMGTAMLQQNYLQKRKTKTNNKTGGGWPIGHHLPTPTVSNKDYLSYKTRKV